MILGEDLTSKQQTIHDLLQEQLSTVIGNEVDKNAHRVAGESKSFSRHSPDERFTITHDDDEQEVQGMNNEELEPVDHDSDIDNPENSQTLKGGVDGAGDQQGQNTDRHKQDTDLVGY